MSGRDPRLTLARPDLAAAWLEGLVPASRYAPATAWVCTRPAASIRRSPQAGAEQVDQLLFGEIFDVLEAQDGWAWGQARRDGYVGHVALNHLGEAAAPPTHRVGALRAYAFAEPSIKAPPVGLYSLNALVVVEGREGRFARAAGGGWFVESQLAPIGGFETDLAGVAERYLGAAYQWGGRESLGLDCSGLVHAAALACGLACPRDTDQQALAGRPIPEAALTRGDLVFWRGHVAIMLDAQRMIHANAFHMAVAIEPLAEAVARIGATDTGAPTGYRRLVG